MGGGGVLLLYLTAFAGISQLAAQGINLVFFLPVGLCALVGHIKNGYVKWKIALVSVVLGIPFVFLGSFIAKSIDKTLLRGAFALFLLFVGIKSLCSKE